MVINLIKYAFCLMVGYDDYLIYIDNNIHENIRNKRKVTERARGIPTKLPIPQLLIDIEKFI